MTPQDRNIARALDRVRNPLTAIRAFCVTCMGGSANLIPSCTVSHCPLFTYRMGRNPKARKRGKPFEITRSNPSDSANSEAQSQVSAIHRQGKRRGELHAENPTGAISPS